MSDTAFENKVSGIFARMERRLGDRLAVEKAKTENLQSQDTRRIAFILTEAIEAEMKPAVNEVLSSYDEAINRPILPNERWEHMLLQRITQSVDNGVKLALALDRAEHPWKPLLTAEAPKLRARVLEEAEQHFARLGKVRRRGRRSAGVIPDWVLWVALFIGGLGAGMTLARLLGG